MEVDLCVEVHEEREVELVGLEQLIERPRQALNLVSQLIPLVGVDVDDGGARPTQHQDRLPEQSLVAVDRKDPGRPLLDDRLGYQRQAHRIMIVDPVPESDHS